MEPIFSRAVIPTNSLYLIANNDILDEVIYYLRATANTLVKSEVNQVHRNIRVYSRETKEINILFNRDTIKEIFNSAEILESVRSAGFGDIWVNEIWLRIKHKGQPYDFVFKNKPLSKGSEASKYAIRYLKSLLRQGFISKIHARHLPLIEVLSNPRGSHISPDDLSDPSFIQWLNEKTGGIVKLKTIKMVAGSEYVDLDITGGN